MNFKGSLSLLLATSFLCGGDVIAKPKFAELPERRASLHRRHSQPPKRVQTLKLRQPLSRKLVPFGKRSSSDLPKLSLKRRAPAQQMKARVASPAPSKLRDRMRAVGLRRASLPAMRLSRQEQPVVTGKPQPARAHSQPQKAQQRAVSVPVNVSADRPLSMRSRLRSQSVDLGSRGAASSHVVKAPTSSPVVNQQPVTSRRPAALAKMKASRHAQKASSAPARHAPAKNVARTTTGGASITFGQLPDDIKNIIRQQAKAHKKKVSDGLVLRENQVAEGLNHTADFMELAHPGLVQKFCNALNSKGFKLFVARLQEFPPQLQAVIRAESVKEGRNLRPDSLLIASHSQLRELLQDLAQVEPQQPGITAAARSFLAARGFNG